MSYKIKFNFNHVSVRFMFALVARVMVYISFDELLPIEREYAKSHIAILAYSLGMLVNRINLILLALFILLAG